MSLELDALPDLEGEVIEAMNEMDEGGDEFHHPLHMRSAIADIHGHVPRVRRIQAALGQLRQKGLVFSGEQGLWTLTDKGREIFRD